MKLSSCLKRCILILTLLSEVQNASCGWFDNSPPIANTAPPSSDASNVLDILNLTGDSICRFIYANVDGASAIVFLPRIGSVYNIMAGTQRIWQAQRSDEKCIFCVVYLDGNNLPLILHNVAREGTRIVDLFYKCKNGKWTDSFRKYDEKIKSIRIPSRISLLTTFGSTIETIRRPMDPIKFTLNVASIECSDSFQHSITKLYKTNTHLFAPKSGYICNKVVHGSRDLWSAKNDEERCIIVIAIEKRKIRLYKKGMYLNEEDASQDYMTTCSRGGIPDVFLENIASVYLLIRTPSYIPKHRYFKKKGNGWIRIKFNEGYPRIRRLGEQCSWKSKSVGVSTLGDTLYTEDFATPKVSEEEIVDEEEVFYNGNTLFKLKGEEPVALDELPCASGGLEPNNSSYKENDEASKLHAQIFGNDFDVGSDDTLLSPVDHRNIKYEENDASVEFRSVGGCDNPGYVSSGHDTEDAGAACPNDVDMEEDEEEGDNDEGCEEIEPEEENDEGDDDSTGSTEYANTYTVDLLNVDTTRARLYRDSLYMAVTPMNDISITGVKYGDKGLWKVWDDEICTVIEMRENGDVIHIKISLETVYGSQYWHFYLQNEIWSRRIVDG
ncbi:hypothetical protein BEWA_035640 [Theileria equi strain WA]|uniref:Signal peptide-containing protein n=1 Tax=Theileria equi strain WA TaxID=1537102 RepID=L1LEC8_THEEQ|nr:hypothetical protein BEWA_035640 [Theileria equi strain WA]EKX73528.1 hypothetical protein BEWA_035640 [Theileria equi strain WA]|eukprot:XP_004832980.1 hypothetical protein BEWA_035640 [Theileria equi strain WA]